MGEKKTSLSPVRQYADKVAWIWFLIDGLTHLILEASYLYLAFSGGAINSNSVFGLIWREYGKADARWAVSDGTIMSLECVTVLIEGPLCLLCVYAIWQRKAYRHVLQLGISLGELYGGWMTFAPEWFTGSVYLNTSTFKFTWIYLFFMNTVWVWIPLVLSVDSVVQIIRACDQAKIEQSPKSGVSRFWWQSIVAVLVLYAALLPGVLLTAELS
eukprot:TRINITY_DN5643_c0_g1_i3.p1 TRINITY_DN5643_c0_g1~~TRINITY_DN5643_c0_g1_i3.p1  ORF type:complete len:214 (+),score=18.56 TRINITY_DN5643_c0_g1_i3:109-750(+)